MAMQHHRDILPDITQHQHHRDSRPDITLPSSSISTPLTPLLSDSVPTEQVQSILDILRRCKDGRYTSRSPWQTFKIRHEEYNNLISLVKEDESLWGFIEDKFRYEYNTRLIYLNF